MTSANNKVVLAMSGGVDSSVSALLLHRAGIEAVGISMQVWDYRNHGGSKSRATCCSPDDFTDARKVAAAIGIPYYVFDFEATFRREVIDKFVQSYKEGYTPNPCVDCNRKVKFAELRERAMSMGATSVATGHYAQIEKRDDGYHLLRGVDEGKDQSYFLFGLTQDELSKTLFPVGHLTKPEVRALAAEAELATASKPESQDICFVSGSTQDFLTNIGGKTPKGTIRLQNGQIIGNHEGIYNFTVGQRKGLKVGGTESPLYVLELQPDTNTVVVGAKESLERESFIVEELTWVTPNSFSNFLRGGQPLELVAQLRHRHKGVPVEVRSSGNDSAHVTFKGDWTTVSPGQACVFYDKSNHEVLGGGRIARQALAQGSVDLEVAFAGTS